MTVALFSACAHRERARHGGRAEEQDGAVARASLWRERGGVAARVGRSSSAAEGARLSAGPCIRLHMPLTLVTVDQMQDDTSTRDPTASMSLLH